MFRVNFVDLPHEFQIRFIFTLRFEVKGRSIDSEQLALLTYGQFRMLRIDPRSPINLRAMQVFFQVGDLHFEATDLLEQCGFVRWLVLLSGPIVQENFLNPLQKPGFPIGYLLRRNLNLGGEFVKGFITSIGGEGDFGSKAGPNIRRERQRLFRCWHA